jgi:hypothetical protein
MTETETEHERKVREYWARAYDDLIKSKDKDSSSNNKSHEPTAVLTSPNPKQRKFRLNDIVNLDFSR